MVATFPKPRFLKLEKQQDGTWAFNDPPEWEFFRAKLDRALDAGREGHTEVAREIYLNIIENCPDYLDAYNNLALLADHDDDVDMAIALWEQAVQIGVACFPEEFVIGNDMLPNYWVDNRPFLRALKNLSVTYLRQAVDSFVYLSNLKGNKSYAAEAIKYYLSLWLDES